MSHPTGERRDGRAAILSDLRAFVDMLENEPSLPVPPSFSCASYVPRDPSDERRSVAEVFAAAEKLDTEVSYNQREGRVETTWKRGSVSYQVYARLRPELDRTRDMVTVTSLDQILTATATFVPVDQVQTDTEKHSRTGGPS